jgi:hypothetical protein
VEEWLASEWRARITSGFVLALAVVFILNNDARFLIVDLHNDMHVRFVNVCVVSAFVVGVALDSIRSIIATMIAFVYPLAAGLIVFIAEFVLVYITQGNFISESIIALKVLTLMWPLSFAWSYTITSEKRKKVHKDALVSRIVKKPWFIFIGTASSILSFVGMFWK